MFRLPGQATLYIIIGGLDARPTTTGLSLPLSEVLGLVKDLVASNPLNMRSCVTNRSEAGVELVLEPLVFRSISLHGERGQIQGTVEYVRLLVHLDPRMQRWKATDNVTNWPLMCPQKGPTG
jgi:hypothetical protein